MILIWNRLENSDFDFDFKSFWTDDFDFDLKRHTWGVMGSLVIALLQIFSWFWLWNNFENRLIFDEVKAYTKMVQFLGLPCIIRPSHIVVGCYYCYSIFFYLLFHQPCYPQSLPNHQMFRSAWVQFENACPKFRASLPLKNWGPNPPTFDVFRQLRNLTAF